MKLQKEHIIGLVIGLIPVIAIAIIFRDNDLMCMLYLKHCTTIANLISFFLEISD